MKKFILLVVLFVVFYSFTSYGQACGGGLFRFQFYTLNGTNFDLTYEIIEIEEESYAYACTTFDERKFYKGLIVSQAFVESIKTSKNSNLFINSFDKIDKEGKILDGRLMFPTIELHSKLYLLKITSKKYCFFIISNLFGGCNRRTKILLEDEEAIILE